MLKEMVERGIGKNWNPRGIKSAKIVPYSADDPLTFSCETDDYCPITGVPIGYQFELSIADLIADDGFMESVYGEEKVCGVCGAERSDTVAAKIKGWCAYDCVSFTKTIPRYQHVKATAINKKDKIEYLYNEMKRGDG
jgi:hypothetical protein